MRTDATDRQQEMDSIARPETSDAGRSDTAAALYIDLLRKCLTREVFDETYITLTATSGRVRRVSARLARGILSRMGLELVRRVPIGERGRVAGAWPSLAETMVGPVRLQHLERCIRDVVARRVTGDLIEAGVWRGGVTIFMRGCLAALGETDRTVWVADSFQGLPRPDAAAYPADVADRLWTCPELAVPLEEVRANFARYGLLDGRVRFLAGWFR
jgi:O-methyltransferase